MAQPQPLEPRLPTPQRHTPQQKWLIRIAIIVAFGLAIWGLSALFPGAISGQGDMAGVAYFAAWGVLVASGLVFSRQVSAGQTVRNIALWLGIFAILAIAYLLICRVGAFDLRSNADIVALGLGILLAGLGTARLFGRFHGGNSPGARVSR